MNLSRLQVHLTNDFLEKNVSRHESQNNAHFEVRLNLTFHTNHNKILNLVQVLSWFDFG